ncbi:hypothetical protein ABBQ32_012756 [Trebouxia sp. C0010 RCD-2024]
MRLAPVPVYWHQDLDTAMLMARNQAQTTPNASFREAMDTGALMAFVTWHGLNGVDKAAVFDLHPSLEGKLDNVQAEVAELAAFNARCRTAAEHRIITLPSWGVWTLEAALWCIHSKITFENAIRKQSIWEEMQTSQVQSQARLLALYTASNSVLQDGCKGASTRTAL